MDVQFGNSDPPLATCLQQLLAAWAPATTIASSFSQESLMDTEKKKAGHSLIKIQRIISLTSVGNVCSNQTMSEKILALNIAKDGLPIILLGSYLPGKLRNILFQHFFRHF